jgi:uncharacterized protein
VKLVIDEPESSALTEYLETRRPALATSRIAVVEVTRAAAIANPTAEARSEAQRLLRSCLLVELTAGLLDSATQLTSREVRTLDAVHLASARWIESDEMLVYDRRLRAAAGAIGLTVAHPGAP